MQVSGKWIILVMVTMALSMASFSWWYRWNTTHRAAAFWKAQGIDTIQTPEKVIAKKLKPRAEAKPGGPISSQYDILEEKDISEARGITHFLQALLADPNFEWSDSPPKAKVAVYLIEIHGSEPDARIDLYFPEDASQMQRALPDGTSVEVLETSADFEKSIAEYFTKEVEVKDEK